VLFRSRRLWDDFRHC